MQSRATPVVLLLHHNYRIVQRPDLCRPKPFLFDKDERVKEWRFVSLTHRSAGESWSMSNSPLITPTDGFWTRSRLPDTPAPNSAPMDFSPPSRPRCAANWRRGRLRFAPPSSISNWGTLPRTRMAWLLWRALPASSAMPELDC